MNVTPAGVNKSRELLGMGRIRYVGLEITTAYYKVQCCGIVGRPPTLESDCYLTSGSVTRIYDH